MDWTLPWTLFAFLESASRGSSWQRCPMLRFIHLVHGLSCSQRQRFGSLFPRGPSKPSIFGQRSHPPFRQGRCRRQTRGLAGVGHTYEIASHVLTAHKKHPVSHASQGLDANASKGKGGKEKGGEGRGQECPRRRALCRRTRGAGQIVERL